MSQILVLDVSQFQPATIDFKKYADAGVRGVYVQATRGNDGSNPYFEQQVKGAIDQGLAVGAYHFCYPLLTAPGHLNRDPRGQATLFKDKALEIISGAPLKMPPMADVEWPLYGDWSKWVVTADSIGDWVPEFVKCVDEDWGKTCGVYTFTGYFDAIPRAHTPDMPGRDLWVAAYPKGDNVVSGPPPVGQAVPRVIPWARATLWQFTGHAEFSPGDYPVDCSVFNGDEAAWQAFLAK